MSGDDMIIETDVVVVGTGAAGLFCALHFPQSTNVLVITKDDQIRVTHSLLRVVCVCSEMRTILMDFLRIP